MTDPAEEIRALHALAAEAVACYNEGESTQNFLAGVHNVLGAAARIHNGDAGPLTINIPAARAAALRLKAARDEVNAAAMAFYGATLAAPPPEPDPNADTPEGPLS